MYIVVYKPIYYLTNLLIIIVITNKLKNSIFIYLYISTYNSRQLLTKLFQLFYFLTNTQKVFDKMSEDISCL